MKAIEIGDILIIENPDFGRDYSGKVWYNNFLRCRHAWRVDDINNNGTIKAHDIHGKRHFIHALDRDKCYPRIVKVVAA